MVNMSLYSVLLMMGLHITAVKNSIALLLTQIINLLWLTMLTMVDLVMIVCMLTKT